MQWVTRLGRLVLVLDMLGMLSDPAWVQAQWIDSLSPEIRSCILWSADHEEGNLHDWHFGGGPDVGGGVFNTGEAGEAEATVSQRVAHSGQFSAKTTIANAIRVQNGNRAVRLMRWTDVPWTAGGQCFPAEAYYSVWMYFPRTYTPNKQAPWDPGDGGWWNVFQFKGSEGPKVSLWGLNVAFDEDAGHMQFYLYSPVNTPKSYVQATPKPVPARQWVHVETFYRYAPLAPEGAIVVWQDGELILNVQGVKTAMVAAGGPSWGIGNYTNHISGDVTEGTATIYFDDAIVGRRRSRSTDIVPACSSPGKAGTLPPPQLKRDRPSQPPR